MPDIVIAGATFRGVPQIDIPTEGSGTASFVYEDGTKQITENGTNIDVRGFSTIDVNVSGGGGGMTNVVTGTFTGRDRTVDIPYTGTGFPVTIVIEVDDGIYKENTAWYKLKSRYAVGFVAITKSDPSVLPAYDGAMSLANMSTLMCTYKNSTSDSTVYSRTGAHPCYNYTGGDAAASSGGFFKWQNNKQFKTSNNGTNTSTQGFASSIIYRYWVIYSE